MISEEFLSKVPIFEKLSSEDVESLRQLWQPRALKAGEVLFRKGELGNSMVIIEEGRIEITVPIDNQKKEMQISVLHEGEFVGELALLDELPRTATVKALGPCRVQEMVREDFLEFVHQRPSVALSMLSEMSQRLRATNELVQSLASRNVNQEIEESQSFGERLSDRIAEAGGSWGFIIGFAVFLALWMVLNAVQLWFQPFDHYPFIFLNLILSCVAAVQAPIIMMSQNRAQKKDRLKAELDYQVNLKSELMLQQLHMKFDEMRSTELREMHTSLTEEMDRLEYRMRVLEKRIEAHDLGHDQEAR